MRILTKLRRRLRVWLDRGAVEREMAEEMEQHLEASRRELEAFGSSPAEARRLAAAAFGGVEAAKEEARDTRGGRFLEDLMGDARYAWRQALRSPGHAASVVAILGVAVAGATVALALTRAYLHRPLPFPEPDRLVSVISAPTRALFPNPPDLRAVDWQPAAALFETTAAWDLDGFTLVGREGAPEYVDGAWVSPGFFDLRGLVPALGRGFRLDEFVVGATVAIISDALWRSRFGADPAVIGTAVRAYSTDRPEDDAMITIIGVLPPTEWHQRFSDVLRPLGTPRNFSLARLPRGVGIEDAAARLTAAVRAQLPSADPAWGMSLVSAQDEHVYSIRPVLEVLVVAAILLLVLAHANIGALLVARGTVRVPELAVRRALGATRGRLVRQLAIESLLLGAAGLALGMLLTPVLAGSAARWMESFGRVTVPGGLSSVGIDAVVAAAIVVVVAVAFLTLAVVPVLGLTGALPIGMSAGRATAGSGALRARRLLATVQVAVAVVLLAQGALLVQTVRSMMRTDVGFDPENLLKAYVLLPRDRYADGPARTAVQARIVDRLAATPGVVSATTAFPDPFRGPFGTPVECLGCADGNTPMATRQTISPEFFTAMRVPLQQGRAFAATDGPDQEPVAIISGELARRL